MFLLLKPKENPQKKLGPVIIVFFSAIYFHQVLKVTQKLKLQLK